MTDKGIIIDGVDVSELTSDQLACMNRYSVAHLFIKLVETLSRTEDDYNKVQGDRVKIWTDNTDLTEQLKRKEQELEKVCKAFDIEYIIDKETGDLIGRCNKLYKKEQECEELKKELEAVYDDCKGCPTCNEALYNANLYAKEYRKLKQTLIEIKGIAEEAKKDICNNCGWRNTDGCNPENYTCGGFIKILQKLART